jgi:hypothetical protein
MARRIAFAALAAVATLSLVGCSGDSPEKEKSLVAFAQSTCGATTTASEAEEQLRKTYDDIESKPSAAEQHAFVVQNVQGFIDLLGEQKASVEKNVPEVEEGDVIVANFSKHWDARIAWAQSQLDEFAAEVPEWGRNEDGVLIAASPLLHSVNEDSMDADLPSPYGQIEDQDVVTALADEPSCDDVVLVF